MLVNIDSPALICMLALAGCGDAVIQHDKDPSSQDQGVYGLVEKTVGDIEPQPGGSTAETLPLSVPVMALQGKVKIDAPTGLADVPDDVSELKVAETRSSQEGEYELGLPPGTFTVIALIEGDYVVPCHENGYACTYQVEGGNFVQVDFRPHYP